MISNNDLLRCDSLIWIGAGNRGDHIPQCRIRVVHGYIQMHDRWARSNEIGHVESSLPILRCLCAHELSEQWLSITIAQRQGGDARHELLSRHSAHLWIPIHKERIP